MLLRPGSPSPPLLQGALSSTHTSHADPTYFDAWAAPAPGSQARLVTRLPLASDGPFAGVDAWDSLPKDAQHSLSGNDSAALGTAAGVGVLPVRLGKHPREWLPNVFSGVTRDDSDDAFLTFIGISDRGPVSVRSHGWARHNRACRAHACRGRMHRPGQQGRLRGAPHPPASPAALQLGGSTFCGALASS